MQKSAPSPPPPPNPVKVAEAQTASNLATAQAQSHLNNVNQIGPTGSIIYTENYVPQYDAKGNLINGSGPQWTVRTILSPEQQRIYDLTTQGQTTYGETANTLLGNTRAMLSNPISTDYDKYRSEAERAAFARLEPRFAQAEEAMRARLLNAGIAPGSAAWENEYRNFNQARNDAWLQTVAQGGNIAGQALQQEAGLRGVPLNEANALLTGQQVSIPQFQQTPSTPIAPTDVVGAYNQGYANQLAAYNAQLANSNSILGGLFGLAGTLGAAGIRWSDRRLKQNIRQVGRLRNGLAVYSYDFVGGCREIGLMADEVAAVRPDAVVRHPIGFLMVDYRKAVGNE
jgi:hypothetical protein